MLDRCAWLDANGCGVAVSGSRIEGADLESSLWGLLRFEAKQVYLTETPWKSAEEGRAWLRRLRVLQDDGSHLTSERFWLRLKEPKSGRRLLVLPAASWFGDATLTPATARTLMQGLDEALLETFGLGIIKTPALTGALCWAKSGGANLPPIAPEHRALLWETSGQGRFECCPVVDPLPALYQLDARLMYGACAESIEIGEELMHEQRPRAGWPDGEAETPGWLGYTPARYHIDFWAPQPWGLTGLLPARDPGGWFWPLHGVGWCDGRELRLALQCGWHVDIRERLRWTTTARSWTKPLRCWAQRLMRLPEQIPDGDEERAPLYDRAIRALLIQAIGLMFRRARTVTASGPIAPNTLRAQQTTQETDDGLLEWEEYAELPALSRAYCRPELAAAVYADARRRLLSDRSAGALHLDRNALVGFALDSIYSTRNPVWTDDGKPGRFRVKAARHGPMAAPTNTLQLYRLTGEAHGETDG